MTWPEAFFYTVLVLVIGMVAIAAIGVFSKKVDKSTEYTSRITPIDTPTWTSKTIDQGAEQ